MLKRDGDLKDRAVRCWHLGCDTFSAPSGYFDYAYIGSGIFTDVYSASGIFTHGIYTPSGVYDMGGSGIFTGEYVKSVSGIFSYGVFAPSGIFEYLYTDEFQLGGTAIPGYVLTADAVGSGTWQPASSGYFSQEYSSNTFFQVDHNLGVYPLVEVFDTSAGEVFYPKTIEHKSMDRLDITLSVATAITVLCSSK